MLNGKTVLVVEEEFLIALDIQRMLETHTSGQMLFARNPHEAHELKNYWPSLGLAIVEVRPHAQHSLDLIRSLYEAAVPVILHTSDTSIRGGHPDFSGAAVLIKPMAEDDLVAAISQVTNRR